MNKDELKYILEAGIHAAAKPMSLSALGKLFAEEEVPEAADMKSALEELQQDYEPRAVELIEVGSGYRFQVKSDYTPWISRLWEEKPAKYSRALLETLALIAYRQPITRGEIEEIRGVSVSTHIIKTLQEREWVRSVGQRDVPGRPTLYASTKQFLDYFNLKSLEELPTLNEIQDLDLLAENLGEVVEQNEESAQAELDIDAVSENSDQQDDEAGLQTDAASVASEDELDEVDLFVDTEQEVADAIARAAALDKQVEDLEDQFAATVSFDGGIEETSDATTGDVSENTQFAEDPAIAASEMTFETIMQNMLSREEETDVTIDHSNDIDEQNDVDRELMVEASNESEQEKPGDNQDKS